MSRGQQQSVINTANKNSSTDLENASKAFGSTEDSIGNYNNQLAKFVSSNPYTKGGEFDQTIGTGLANISDAGANSLKGALAATALRTGQNSASNAATAESAAQQNTRDLSASLAEQQQKRIAGEAGYNQEALGATSVPIGANANLYGTSVGAGNAALNTAAGSSQTPGFWDQVGSGLAKLPEEILTGKG